MRSRPPNQYPLFDAPSSFPNGFEYRPEVITPEEEAELVRRIQELPLRNAPFHEYIAKRRVYGWWGNRKLPEWLLPITAKIAECYGLPPEAFKNALVSEYSAGTGVGWHRDAPPYKKIFGLSLAGWAEFELRPNGTRQSRRYSRSPRSLAPCM
jgi:hypothetical protein